jgi:hypothetical protein
MTTGEQRTPDWPRRCGGIADCARLDDSRQRSNYSERELTGRSRLGTGSLAIRVLAASRLTSESKQNRSRWTFEVARGSEIKGAEGRSLNDRDAVAIRRRSELSGDCCSSPTIRTSAAPRGSNVAGCTAKE